MRGKMRTSRKKPSWKLPWGKLKTVCSVLFCAVCVFLGYGVVGVNFWQFFFSCLDSGLVLCSSVVCFHVA